MAAPRAPSAEKFVSGPPSSVRGFLFYGSDSLQISARAEALAGQLAKKIGPEAEVIRLHESDAATAPDRIATELNTGSLFGGAKIVWLTALPAKAQSALLEAVAHPIEGAFLIAQAPDMKKSHKLVQVFEGTSTLRAISCYGEDRETIISAIREQVSSAQCEIDADAAALVAARCDSSTLLARSEVEKLITYAGQTRHITSRAIEDCLIDQQTAELSDITDHALGGEGRKAIQALERFLAVEQDTTPVFKALSSGLVRLHALRTAMDAGKSVMQAIKDLKPPVFFKQQDRLAAQVHKWTAPALAAVFQDFNAVLKETRLKPALAEHLTAGFILRIAKKARRMTSRP